MGQITLSELVESLNGYLAIDTFKDYGPNGLQVRGREVIKKIAYSPTASLEIIDQAIAENADALIVHHGIFWEKDSRVLDGPLLEKVKKCLSHGLSLIAYHLPLDAHNEVGNNFVALRKLGATQLQLFEGIGAKGQLHLSKDRLLQQVESLFGVKPLCPPSDTLHITSIAMVSGGGHACFKAACAQSVDAFISGTSDEWVWDYGQEANVLFIPVGHYRSETLGVKALGEYISKQWGIESLFLQSNNPY